MIEIQILNHLVKLTNISEHFRILNSNPVKCSVKCGNLEYHQMRRIYTDCMCNKDECDKRYSYICCENQTTWYLTTTGHHPFVQMAEDEKIKQYEIPIKIKELFDQICDSNPDLRPKQLMVHVETCRRTNERLANEIMVQKQRYANFVPKYLPDPNYLFPSSLLPSLQKVIFNAN